MMQLQKEENKNHSHTRPLSTQSTHQQSPSHHHRIARCATDVESHAKAQCPARDVTCHTCGKRGHYSKVCKSTKTVHVVETDCNEDIPLFIGSVDAGLDPWFADLTQRNHKVRFKIDTGADVSVIPAHIYHAITEGDSQLVKPDRSLFGPGRVPLSVLGRYSESLSESESECKGEQVKLEEIYVVNNFNIAL